MRSFKAIVRQGRTPSLRERTKSAQLRLRTKGGRTENNSIAMPALVRSIRPQNPLVHVVPVVVSQHWHLRRYPIHQQFRSRRLPVLGRRWKVHE